MAKITPELLHKIFKQNCKEIEQKEFHKVNEHYQKIYKDVSKDLNDYLQYGYLPKQDNK